MMRAHFIQENNFWFKKNKASKTNNWDENVYIYIYVCMGAKNAKQ